MTAAEDPQSEKRGKILHDSLSDGHQARWGYFGVTGPLCIGDNSLGVSVTRKVKVEDQDPVRNPGIIPLKKGAHPDVYFSFEPPLCSDPGKDPYIDPHKVNADKLKVTMLDPERPFKPAKATNMLTFPGKDENGEPKDFVTNKLGYCYVPHMDNLKNPQETYEKYKGVLPPANMKTNPSKKGGPGVHGDRLYCGFETADGQKTEVPEWQPEPFDSAKELRMKEIKDHHSKTQEAPFNPSYFGGTIFMADKDLLAFDKDRDGPTNIPRTPRLPKLKITNHEAPFRPANPMKKGVVKGTFEWNYEGEEPKNFPKWMEDPMPPSARRKPKVEDEKVPFRIGAQPRAAHNPMPSVCTNLRNMRSERPSAFVRPRF